MKQGVTWVSNFESDSNPGQLFIGVKQNVSIFLHYTSGKPFRFTTRLSRFFSEGRNFVFPGVRYVESTSRYIGYGFPKTGEIIEAQILEKLFSHPALSEQLTTVSGQAVLVHRIAHYFIKCFDFVPYFRSDRDGVKKSEDYKEYLFEKPIEPIVAAINSTTFYFYWQAFYDGFKAGKYCVEHFPFRRVSDKSLNAELVSACSDLLDDIRKNAIRLSARYATTGDVEYDQFFPRKSKALADRIDELLKSHYGFTAEESDFVINYDVKFRVADSKED